MISLDSQYFLMYVCAWQGCDLIWFIWFTGGGGFKEMEQRRLVG
jgi:hypothetical protein